LPLGETEQFTPESNTLTLTLSDAEPPGPVQLIEYVCDVVRLPVETPGFEVPVHPVGDTVQEEALVELQLMLAEVL